MNGTIAGGVTCGNCTKKNGGLVVKHASAADVRECYAGRYGQGVIGGSHQRYLDATADYRTDDERAMDAMVAASEREEDRRVAADKAKRDEGVTWGDIRAAGEKLPNLPHMRYAIEVIDFEHGPEPVWKFYQIDKPQKGKWAGRTFVSVMASDDTYPVRKPQSILAILGAIAADPEKAASDFGHQIGRCGICHRTLTDPESIAHGIGPVCRAKAGW